MIAYAMHRDESKCCGCSACVQACHSHAIHMEHNEEGFLYPVVQERLCTQCGMCSTVCPMENAPQVKPPIAYYAVAHKNIDVLQTSTSGGAFQIVADYVLDRDGCVVGCVWNGTQEPILTIAETPDELKPMHGSKYLSSTVGDIYVLIKKLLEDGKLVLFTGAPCQNAGLLGYLRKPYENLITMEFLCHGMPSHYVFNAYIAELERKHRAKVSHFQFRDKALRGWGLVESYCVNEKKYYSVGLTSPYLFGFVQGYFNRYSCYACPFRGHDRFTDFTVGDYWGVERYHPAFDMQSGVSAVSINTEKAEAIIENVKVSAIFEKTSVEWISEENPAILHQVREELPSLRKQIYACIQNDGWNKVEKRYLKCKHYAVKRVWYRLPNRIVKAVRYFRDICARLVKQ